MDRAGVRPVQVHALLVRAGDGDGRVEVVADAAEDVGVAEAGFQDGFEVVPRHVDVPVEHDDGEQGGLDVWEEDTSDWFMCELQKH